LSSSSSFRLSRTTVVVLAALIGFSLSCDSSGSTAPGRSDKSEVSLQLSTVSASQASIVANGTSTSQITVSLKDADGASIGKSGGTVAISATRGTVGPVSDQNNGTYTTT